MLGIVSSTAVGVEQGFTRQLDGFAIQALQYCFIYRIGQFGIRGLGTHTQELIQMLVIVQLGGGDEFAVDMILLRCGDGHGFGRGRCTGLADFGKQFAIVLFAHSGIEQPLPCRHHHLVIGIGTQAVDGNTGLYRFFIGGGFNF